MVLSFTVVVLQDGVILGADTRATEVGDKQLMLDK